MLLSSLQIPSRHPLKQRNLWVVYAATTFQESTVVVRVSCSSDDPFLSVVKETSMHQWSYLLLEGRVKFLRRRVLTARDYTIE